MRFLQKTTVFVGLMLFLACSGNDSYRLIGFKRQDDGVIAFDLQKGEQRIRATCTASQVQCTNLTLRAGSSVPCYMHPETDKWEKYKISGPYDVRVDAYSEAGLVCHVGGGRGKSLVTHTQKCVDMK